MNVRRGPKPPANPALAVPDRYAAHHKPAEFPSLIPQARFQFERSARLYRTLPMSQNIVIGMQPGLDQSGIFHFRKVQPGEFHPAAIHVFEFTLWTAEPNNLGSEFG